MKIAIIGTGYVGLVSGACMSQMGIEVTCVDIDAHKISQLINGTMPIYEPGLEEMVKYNSEKGRLTFTTDLKQSLLGVDAVFIAVGTPPDADGFADLKYVLTVAEDIGRCIDHYMVVVTKSTVPVGTSMKVKNIIFEELNRRNCHIEFDVASNPEFLKEGSAIDDFMKPDRIVIGVESDRAAKIMRALYKAFLLNNHPMLVMDIASSEMTKYAANSMLATKISFMNDIANLCELVGADVDMVRKGIGSDTRIGDKFIYSGIGYGGSCFPKDVQALIKIGEEEGHNLKILEAVEAVNYRQKSVLIDKIRLHFNRDLKDLKFGIWGLSFKPKTDDMREAPSLVIIDKLLKRGSSVIAFDPVAQEEARKILRDSISYAKDMYDVCVDSDALIIVTEWPEFRTPNFELIKTLMKTKTIFDGRNIYDLEEMRSLGFDYYCIGRKPVIQL